MHDSSDVAHPWAKAHPRQAAAAHRPSIDCFDSIWRIRRTLLPPSSRPFLTMFRAAIARHSPVPPQPLGGGVHVAAVAQLLAGLDVALGIEGDSRQQPVAVRAVQLAHLRRGQVLNTNSAALLRSGRRGCRAAAAGAEGRPCWRQCWRFGRRQQPLAARTPRALFSLRSSRFGAQEKLIKAATLRTPNRSWN